MYILFPISIMYYFGTNLDGRFSVPEFWPKPGQTHRIPYEREEIAKELQRMKERNLENKHRREEAERRMREGGAGREV
jgi:protein PET100